MRHAKLIIIALVAYWLISLIIYNHFKQVTTRADIEHFNAEVRAIKYTKWAIYQEPELPADFYAMLRIRELDKHLKRGGTI